MSKLTLLNLRSLVPDMKNRRIEKEHFAFTYANRQFDCIFSFTHTAYELLVGIFELNYGFVIPVNEHYVAEISNDIYFRLCELLDLNYSSDHFTSNVLLTLLSSHIPEFTNGVVVSYDTLHKYTICRFVDESDKIYFKGWNDHTKDHNTARNFDKTEFYFGKSVADYCRKHNISSLWTAIKTEEKSYNDPIGFLNNLPELSS